MNLFEPVTLFVKLFTGSFMSLILYRIFSFIYFNFNVLPPKLCAYLARTSIESSIRSNTLLMFPTYFRL